MHQRQPAPFEDPLSAPIESVRGIGPKLSQLFAKKGIRTIEDALYFLPRTYEDRRQLKRISEILPGRRQTGLGEVVRSAMVFYRRARRRAFEAVVGDGTGWVTLKWFHGHKAYLQDRFKKGRRLIFSGEVRSFGQRKEIHHPDVEFLEGDVEKDSLHFGRIVPIYSETEGLHQRVLRRLMKHVVDAFAEGLSSPIPSEILKQQDLMDFKEAFRKVHFPPDDASIEELNRHRSPGHRRIIFDEFFFLELGLALKKEDISLDPGIPFQCEGHLARRFLDRLPFTLTLAQERVYGEIKRDMERPHPMNRLIQGDVGCGKTVVGLLAGLHAIECGYQAALMVPTEVLAVQHAVNLRRWLEPLGIRVALLTSNLKGREREGCYRALRSGDLQMVIGTHALIQEAVSFHRLGLAIIDEQHRFGVVQRGLLRKKGLHPDILVMTATPIPRTLALTIYGDLDVSVIDRLPEGRRPVQTRVLTERAREQVYRMIGKEAREGRQVFVVYPLVEESENLDLKDATQMEERLQREIFPDLRVGLLHGRMKNEEKEAVMTAFQDRAIHILVATTVIEVGIDIPNATLLVVEHAERYGLSQLHQLRGRIGRGVFPSTCVLMVPERCSEDARVRLRAMERTADGFQIAEEDLALRGPGEFFGVRQSGLPDLRAAHLLRDMPVLVEARREAFQLIQQDRGLHDPAHRGLREALVRRWSGRLDLANIG